MNKEAAYISKGFKSRKKAPKCFEEHHQTRCHKSAATYHVVIPKCKDVGEMTNHTLVESRKRERKYLLDVIRCLRYLARQGVALQGNNSNDNFTQLMFLLGTKDENITAHLNRASGNKYTHHDIQNELLDIMARHVILSKLDDIRKNIFFSIMADEYTDISNKEQFSFCTRTVDDRLDVIEDFLGFYELENIKSETIVNAIKDIMLRFNLELKHCRGQTYDGASNMMGKKSGVATRILAEQSKAIVTHCLGHSLSLAVKDLTAFCKILGDTMGTVGEICVLVKYSPKGEKMLGRIRENIEGEFFDDNNKYSALDKLCVTRWTVRASCFQKVIDNYPLLLCLWDECLKEKLDGETRARIVGCKAQMKTFNFFFGLCIGQRLYSITDNVSKTLQKEKMSAVSGQRLAGLTTKTIQGMRNDADYNLFYQTVSKKAEKIDGVEEPVLTRKRRRPNYSVIQFVAGHEETSNATEAYYPTTVEEYFKKIYFEAVDSILTEIKDRFEQPCFIIFSNVEQLFLKSIKKECYQQELDDLLPLYCKDVDATALPTELLFLQTICKDAQPIHFGDIVEKLRTVSAEERALIPNVISIVKIVLVNGATSATPERSFSLSRRLKTWFRACMKQKRFNALAILHAHKDKVDELPLLKVANDFVENRPNRRNEFGFFSDTDLH